MYFTLSLIIIVTLIILRIVYFFASVTLLSFLLSSQIRLVIVHTHIVHTLVEELVEIEGVLS